jgi:hypothetical protein
MPQRRVVEDVQVFAVHSIYWKQSHKYLAPSKAHR